MANGDPNKKKTVDEFALSIKEKYPQYKDVDNLTLAKKMVEKYPIYADKVDLGSQGVEPVGKQQTPASGVSPSPSVSGGSSSGLQVPEKRLRVNEEGKIIPYAKAYLSPEEAKTAPLDTVERSLKNYQQFYGADLYAPGSNRYAQYQNMVSTYRDRVRKEGEPNKKAALFQQEAFTEILKEDLNKNIITEDDFISYQADPEAYYEDMANMNPDIFRMKIIDPVAFKFEKEKLQREKVLDITERVKQKFIETIPEGERTPERLRALEEELWQEGDIRLDLTGDKIIGEKKSMLSEVPLGFLKGGTSQMLALLSAGADLIGAEETARYLDEERKKEVERLSKYMTQVEGDILDNLSQGNLNNAARLSLQMTGESLPLMLGTRGLVGGISKPLLRNAVSYGTFSGVSAIDHYQDVKNEKWFNDMSDIGKLGYLAAYGGAEGIGEMVGSRVAVKAFKGLSTGDKIAKQSVSDFFKEYGKALGVAFSEEGLAEGVTGVSQYIADTVAQGGSINIRDAWDAFSRSAVAGMGMAGVTTTAGKGLKGSILALNSIAVKKADKELKDILNAAQQTDNIKEKDILAARAKELSEIKSQLTKQEGERLDRFSEEDLRTYAEKTRELNEVSSDLKEVEEGSEAEKILKEKAQRILGEISELNDKYKEDAVQERKTEEVPVGEQAQVGEEMVGEVQGQEEEVEFTDSSILSKIDDLENKQKTSRTNREFDALSKEINLLQSILTLPIKERFKFKNTTVINNDGSLKIVYRSGNINKNRLNFFAEDPSVTSQYSVGENFGEYYLSIKNPLDRESLKGDEKWLNDWANRAKKPKGLKFKSNVDFKEQLIQAAKDGYIPNYSMELWYDFLNSIPDDYDGYASTDPTEGVDKKIYVTKNSNQIISSDGSPVVFREEMVGEVRKQTEEVRGEEEVTATTKEIKTPTITPTKLSYNDLKKGDVVVINGEVVEIEANYGDKVLLTNGSVREIYDDSFDTASKNEKSEKYTSQEKIIKPIESLGSSNDAPWFPGVYDEKGTPVGGRGRVRINLFSKTSEELNILSDYVNNISSEAKKIYQAAMDYGGVVTMSLFQRGGKMMPYIDIYIGDTSDAYYMNYTFDGDGWSSMSGVTGRTSYNLKESSVLNGIKKYAFEYNTAPKSTIQKIEASNQKKQEAANKRSLKTLTPSEEKKYKKIAPNIPPRIAKAFQNKANASVLSKIFPPDSPYAPLVKKLSEYFQMKGVKLSWLRESEALKGIDGLWSTANQKLELNKKSIHPEHTISHELTHAVVENEVRKYVPVSLEGIDYINGLRKFIEKAKKSDNPTEIAVANLASLYLEAAEKAGVMDALIRSANKRGGIPGVKYGFTDLSEFIAESFSNRNFQQVLNELPSSRGKSLWNEFTELVQNLVRSIVPNFNIREGSILEAVLNESGEVIKGQDAFFSSQQKTETKEVTEQPTEGVNEGISEGVTEEVRGEEEVTATTKEVDKVAKVAGVKAKNIRGLYDINRKMFGQNRVKSLASAVVMDRAIGQMAKRSGVSKAEMYGKIQFKKGEKAPSGALKQEALIFKSTAQEGIGKIQQKAATPEQWVKMINDKGGKGTSQELEWIGLEDFLNDYKRENNVKSVPKEVVEQYINDNQIEIVEVGKGEGKSFRYNSVDEYLNEIERAERSGDYDLAEELTYEMEDFDLGGDTGGVGRETKYSQYTLEGGENYREVLLTLPDKLVDQLNDEMFRINSLPYTEEYVAIKRNELNQRILKLKEKGKINENYKSSHWGETNILAHLRINERTLPNGERVMFIEEVQSDWAQEGKKKGFKDNLSEVQKKYDELYQKSKKLESEALKYKRENISPNTSIAQAMEMDSEFKKKYEAYREAERQRLEILPSVRKNEGKVPQMPYKKTDQWVGMAMRRALKMAADEGFDRVAWVTGEQSAERYDLSKQIDGVSYDYSNNYLIATDKNGNVVMQERVPEERLEDYIGKETAQKIVDKRAENKVISKEKVVIAAIDGGMTKAQAEKDFEFLWQNPTDTDGRPTRDQWIRLDRATKTSGLDLDEIFYGKDDTPIELKNQDLKVGGEGMKAFYNSILPNVAKKEAQRFDKNAKVEVVDFRGKTTQQNERQVQELKKQLQSKENLTNEEQRTLDNIIASERAIKTDEVSKQLSIAITPEMRINLNSAVPLFQGEQGAMLAEDGRFIIYALTDPNVSTPLHELAHVYEHYLTEAERNSVLKWAGAKEWTTEVSEKFARGFERYLAEGKAPTVSLQKIFDKFKEWLTDIYNGITGSEIDLKLNKPMTDLYNQMLGEAKAQEKVEPTTKEVKSPKETKARAEELKSKIKDRLKGKKLGFAYDPKQQAKEDLDFFKDVVELASIYIQQGVKNAEQFAKKAGIEFNRLSREAFKAAKKGDIGYDEQNIWEVMSAIIPKKEKKAVEANRKAVQRKYKKGDYTNIQDEVAAFIDLPLHRISDQALLNQVNETLANARKGKVNPKELTELTQQVKENLNQQELSIDPNDFTPERLNERLGNIPERIGKIKDDDFDKNTLKDSRSRFSRLINDLRFLENVNNILFELKQLTQDQFQENQKAIADARAKLNEKAKNADANIQEALKELNKENENKAKVYRPQDVTDDPILENEVRNFFEAIEDYDADDISLALEVADIFDDLEVGYIPVGKMAEIANTITATVAANSEGMQKAKDNIASMPKEKSGFIARAFEMFNPVRKASVDFQEWVKRFRNQEFWSWENILGVNKESPIYKLLNDVVTQGEAYSESVATEMAALYKALKFPVLRKGIAGKERLEGAYKQFMKNLSSPENREKRVMVGMIMIERRFRELYDKPFWNNVMSDKDKTNRLSGKKDKLLGGVSEIEIYEKAYAKLPKNEDGTIDLEAAFKQVRKDRISNSLINFLEEKFDENGELAQKQKVANQKRGLPTDFGRFYFPFLRKGGISQETKEFDFNDFFSAVNPKIASDRGKEIKDSSYSMMEADPLSVFSDYIHQVNRDYHLTDAIRTAYKFFNQAIKDSEGEAKTVFSAMKDALKANVAWAFQAPDSTITDKLLQASYAWYLTTMYRAVAEPTSEMIRSIGAGEINTKMLKYAYDEGMSSIKDMFAKVKGLRLNENGEIETTGEFRSNFKKLLDFTNSPFRRQFSRQFADGSIRTSAKRDAGLFEKTSNMIMGFPNRASLFALWMPAFDNRYKEITGKDFDYTKIGDENYLKDNRKDIRDAAAYADKNTARYKGYATALGGRTMNKAFALPFIPIWRKTNIDALKNPERFKMNQFLGSFGWRDSFNIAEGVRDIALSLGDNMTSEDLKKYMTDNPTTALRTITALIASGISYPIIMRMMAYLDAKDEDEEDLPQWKKDMVKDVEENGFFTIDGMIQESLGYATFLATSKYGYSSRFGTLTLLGIIQNQLLNQKKFATKEEKKKIDAAIDRINETSKAFLFSEPINLTGSGQWGAATPAKDVIEMIPGYGLPMQFGIQLEKSINTVIKAEERGTDEQQKAAYILAANDLIKTALLFGGGTVLPAGKEIDRIATGKKIKLSEELTEKEGGSLDLKNLKPSLPEMPSIF